jgi:hypothetical protein
MPVAISLSPAVLLGIVVVILIKQGYVRLKQGYVRVGSATACSGEHEISLGRQLGDWRLAESPGQTRALPWSQLCGSG